MSIISRSCFNISETWEVWGSFIFSWSTSFEDLCLCGCVSLHLNFCQIRCTIHLLHDMLCGHIQGSTEWVDQSIMVSYSSKYCAWTVFTEVLHVCFVLQCLRIRIRLWSWWSTPVRGSCTTTSVSVGVWQRGRHDTSLDRLSLLCTTATR